jgi:predicted nucleotidyltransferase
MIRPQTIDRAIDIIVAQCEPEQIFVIGSYATGTAKRTSDLDLLIVQASTEAKRKRDERVEFLLAPLLIPVDVNVYTPAEFDEECRQPFGFARTATELQGKLVYSRELGDFASLGRRWDGEPGAARHQRLQKAPAEWQLYQAQYARAARGWPEPAWTFAAAVVHQHPGARVADLGCGERALARAVDRPVASFDHCAADDQVTVADLADVPLVEASVDVAVLCLSLVGANWPDYLAEAARIVAPGGRVVVTECAAGPRSAEAIAAVLAERGLPGAAVRSRGPFIDIDARKPSEGLP